MNKGKYTVNEVEERTTIPASTLRQWERRYDFPKPERAESGYRLYSDTDIASIQEMRRHIADGIPASRAAELVQRMQQKQQAQASPRALNDIAQDLIQALLELDDQRADDVFSEAYALHPIEAVLTDVVRETLVTIGHLWHDGKIKTTTEHFASNYIQGKLRALYSITSNTRHAPKLIVACAPSDQHELGALMMAVVLRRAGYKVYYIGADTPVNDLIMMATHLNADAIMISATAQDSYTHLTEYSSTFKSIEPLVIFGGSVFDKDPQRAKQLGGRYLSHSLVEAVNALNDLIRVKSR